MSNKLMTHVVAGYPNTSECIELLLGMQEVGVSIIEIQIPFSDPGADGPVIMKANDIAIENDMTVQGCFDMIKQARTKGLTVPIYLMSYANKIMSFGAENFCRQAQNTNVSGFIIPDLPYDTVDYRELATQCKAHDLDLVPVLSPGILDDRLTGYGLNSHKLIYVTSTKGITGKELEIKQELRDLVIKIRAMSKAQVALGFGIRNVEDVRQTLELVDLAVVGSAVIAEIEQKGVSAITSFLQRLS